MELFKELTDVSRGVRRLGAAAVDLCHVALGEPSCPAASIIWCASTVLKSIEKTASAVTTQKSTLW